MILADDLRMPCGVLLMTRASVLEAHHIAQIRRFEKSEGAKFSVYVCVEGPQSGDVDSTAQKELSTDVGNPVQTQDV